MAPAAIAAQCAEGTTRSVTTSTYGPGDSFNEELMVAMARSGGGNHYYGDTADDLMDPIQRELELLGNLCLRDLRLSATVPDGVEVQSVNELPTVTCGWRLPDLAWGAEAWVVLRLKVPAVALPPAGNLLSVLRVSVTGQSLDGDEVQLERAGLALPAMSLSAVDGLADDELVTRRLIKLAAADALACMRSAAADGNWSLVDRMLEDASRQFAGNEWVAAMLAAMKAIAESRSRERMLKESMYSSSRLRNRLVSKDEDMSFSLNLESSEVPSYLRRKPSQGKGDV